MSQYSLVYLEELPKYAEEIIHQGHIRDEAAEGIVCNYKSGSRLLQKSNKVKLSVPLPHSLLFLKSTLMIFGSIPHPSQTWDRKKTA